jgi:hypothetical protein
MGQKRTQFRSALYVRSISESGHLCRVDVIAQLVAGYLPRKPVSQTA